MWDGSGLNGWIRKLADALFRLPSSCRYRSIYSGGDHVATIMSYPHEGIMVLNGQDGSLAGTVKTNEATTRVMYVPEQPTGAYCSAD
mmetsp:Transcript_14140/g.32399  ORF Transcript_14140/g.32399 Transcript_14140/m.32399 type:complete len:87 (-) Transcript_14140:86-346(-)